MKFHVDALDSLKLCSVQKGTDGQTDGLTEGRTDGQTDGRTSQSQYATLRVHKGKPPGSTACMERNSSHQDAEFFVIFVCVFPPNNLVILIYYWN